MKKIVTVQDISCYGQCSITVALPVLSALGVETAILPSSILSTHTGGFKNFTCLDLTEEMPKITAHWKSEGILFDAIYTGYIGDTRQFDTIIDMKSTLLREGGLMIVDPAMADHGKLYPALNEDIVSGMRSLVREADVILPNLTEAAFLLERDYVENPTRDEAKDILRALSEMGPKLSILTGVTFEEGKIGAACYDRESGDYTEYLTEKIPQSYHGTGDIFSSVAAAYLVNGETVEKALQEACLFTADCIRATLPYPEHGYGVTFETVLKTGRN